jgi:hypothetical protein
MILSDSYARLSPDTKAAFQRAEQGQRCMSTFSHFDTLTGLLARKLLAEAEWTHDKSI